MMKQTQALKECLTPGQVYRREDLACWSNAVDRHLKLLQAEGALIKLSGGLYYYPEQTPFGPAPAKEADLVRAFLRDDRFLITSLNAYNTLGIGLTQLYNETVVYNHKRHGRFTLGGRMFEFRMRPHFPQAVTEPFLLVDVVNNLDRLAEDQKTVLTRIQECASKMDRQALQDAIIDYGSVKTRKWFSLALENTGYRHAG
jgi:hypothetical protein